MGKVSSIDESAIEWIQPPGKAGVHFKILYSTAQGGPNVQLAEYEPGHEEHPHSHPTSELLYILEGELSLGEERVGPGTMLFVEKDTVYGPLIGGQRGVKFLRVELP